MRYPRENSDIV